MFSFTMCSVLGGILLLTPARPRAHAVMHGPVRMVATAFCDKGETRLGVEAHSGIAAADPRVLPLGSTVRVDGLRRGSQTFVVTDTGSAVKGRHIDLFIASCAAARRFGKRLVLVRLLKEGDPAKR